MRLFRSVVHVSALALCVYAAFAPAQAATTAPAAKAQKAQKAPKRYTIEQIATP